LDAISARRRFSHAGSRNAFTIHLFFSRDGAAGEWGASSPALRHRRTIAVLRKA